MLMICNALIRQFSSEVSSPFVFLTVIHTSPPKNKHDATSVWAEEVTKYNFKACVRELKNFDGAHSGVKVVSKFNCDGSEQISGNALSPKELYRAKLFTSMFFKRNIFSKYESQNSV